MQAIDGHHGDQPLISVVMANFEAGEKIVPALRSVLGQSLRNLEVIVSDDCSGDDSIAHVRRFMASDERVRLVLAPENGGPARSRNRAIEAARGRWIAIVDSDDIIHPERFERLLAAANHFGTHIVADDLLLFFEDGAPPQLMLGEDQNTTFRVTPEQWVLAGVDGSPPLGYLKPLIHASLLDGVRYDETLRIGEDYDLVLRLLLKGARMVVVPEPFYLYRRHSGSISHRLSAADMRAMIERQVALMLAMPRMPTGLYHAFNRRLEQLRGGLAYEELVASIKARRLPMALGMVANEPAHLRRLWRSFSEGRRKRQQVETAATSRTPILGAGSGAGDWRRVPGYVPVGLIDWTKPGARHLWRDLAGLRGRGALRCVCADQAGLYAAGFIPEAVAEFANEAPERARVAT